MAYNQAHYKKLRALLNWLLESIIHCTIVCVMMVTLVHAITLLSKKLNVELVSENRLPIACILMVVFLLIIRSFRLIKQFEAIDNQNDEILITTNKKYPGIIPKKLDYNFPKDIMDEDMHLVCSMSGFVKYCVSHKYYYPYTIGAWNTIDGLITNRKGMPISAKQLAQSYQDLLSKGRLPLQSGNSNR